MIVELSSSGKFWGDEGAVRGVVGKGGRVESIFETDCSVVPGLMGSNSMSVSELVRLKLSHENMSEQPDDVLEVGVSDL